MKRRILSHLLASAALALPALCSAETIGVISQTYSISGTFGPNDPALNVPYSLSGSSPVSLSSLLSDPRAAETFATGGVDPSGKSLAIEADILLPANGVSTAEIIWRASENCLLDVNILLDDHGPWRLDLVDETASLGKHQ
jgi:hypothetical protein